MQQIIGIIGGGGEDEVMWGRGDDLPGKRPLSLMEYQNTGFTCDSEKSASKALLLSV